MSTQTTHAPLSDSMRSLIGQPPLPHPAIPAAPTSNTTSSTSSTTTTGARPVDPTPIPTLHHARSQLREVEQLLLSMWTATLPNLDGDRTAHLCAAHRAVHEALLLLVPDDVVVADLVAMPNGTSATSAALRVAAAR